MKMKYKELNLKAVRDGAEIDFAHYTYKHGMCSCCYGPRDLASIHWKNRHIAECGEEYTYLLFKNADNGSGVVTANDTLKDVQYISWDFEDEKLDKVCELLQSQLNDSYKVIKPASRAYCIEIRYVG